MDLTESTLLHQPNNGDLQQPDTPHQQKNLELQCDICWKVFTRKDHLTRHKKIHYAKNNPSSYPIKGSTTILKSTTIVKKGDKTEEFDKELMDESREVLKIYKLLQRMKQNNNTVY